MNKQVKIKVWHLVAILAFVFIAAGIGGQGIGANLVKDEIEKKEAEVDSLQAANEDLQEIIDSSLKDTQEDKQEIKTFENEYRYERSLRLRLQRENAALRDAVFSYSELDSIADYYWFKRD